MSQEWRTFSLPVTGFILPEVPAILVSTVPLTDLNEASAFAAVLFCVMLRNDTQDRTTLFCYTWLIVLFGVWSGYLKRQRKKNSGLVLPSVNVQINSVYNDFRTRFNYICTENKTDGMKRAR